MSTGIFVICFNSRVSEYFRLYLLQLGIINSSIALVDVIMRYRKHRGWMITCLSALQFNKFASILRYYGILIYAGFGYNSKCAVKQDRFDDNTFMKSSITLVYIKMHGYKNTGLCVKEFK